LRTRWCISPRSFPAYDLVVACQAVPDVVPALDRIAAQGRRPPPLIEHDGLVPEAAAGPKHRTARYVGVCRSIRDAAARRMPDRPHHALELARGEGMPHVIAEAGAAALPVVATCDNGTAQQITHGETGLFVPHADPLAVARTVAALLTDPALRSTLGHNLRCKVAKEYSAASVAKRWQALFDEVLYEDSVRH
jgi:glycosyltransferase involved in cell wall biosynthesis